MARADRRQVGARGAPGGAPAPRRRRRGAVVEDTMFFPKLRAHAKWVFVLLAIVFMASFVFLGVGSGSSGIGDLLHGNWGDLFSSSSGSSAQVEEGPEADRQEPEGLRRVPRPRIGAGGRRRRRRRDRDAPAAEVGCNPKDVDGLTQLAGLYLRKADDARTVAVAAQAEAQSVVSPSTFAPGGDATIGKAYQSLGAPVATAIQTKENGQVQRRLLEDDDARTARPSARTRTSPRRARTTRASSSRSPRRPSRRGHEDGDRGVQAVPEARAGGSRPLRPSASRLKQLQQQARYRASARDSWIDSRPHKTGGRRDELRHQDGTGERRRVRDLARRRGRPLHGPRVQAAAARGDRAGRQGRDRRLHATRRSSTRPRSACSSAASSASARTKVSCRSSAATATSRRSSRSPASTASSRSIRPAKRRWRRSERPQSSASCGRCCTRRSLARRLGLRLRRGHRRPRNADKSRGKQLFTEKCALLPHARRGEHDGQGRPEPRHGVPALDRKQGFEESTIRQVVADQIRFPGDYGDKGPTMPKDLVTGEGVDDVAAYVASVAGQKPAVTGSRRPRRRRRRRRPRHASADEGGGGGATSRRARRRSSTTAAPRATSSPPARLDGHGRARPRQAEGVRGGREHAAGGLHPRVDRRARTPISRRATRRASCPRPSDAAEEHARRARRVPREVRRSSYSSRERRAGPVRRGSLPNL